METAKRICLIDDEPDILKVTAWRLTKAGYEVVVAVDGPTGLALIEKDRPDLILLDLNLPGMSGEEICLKIKKDPNLKKIPVIVFTASRQGARELSKSIGAENYVLKPYEPQNLLNIVKQYIGK